MTSTKHMRSDRVGDRIRAELMELLTRGALRDPGLSECFITEVRLTNDLRHGRVYVRLLKSDVSAEEQKRTIDALYRANGYIRRELAPRLQLKYHPELKYFWDDNIDRAVRIESLLAEIDPASRGRAGSAALPSRTKTKPRMGAGASAGVRSASAKRSRAGSTGEGEAP